MLYEHVKPSKILITFSIIPIIIIIFSIYLTDFFSQNPTLPPMYSAFLPLFLLVISCIISFFGYTTAKDEEPEWGNEFVFKILQGLNLSYIIVSTVILILIILLYFTNTF